MKYINMGGFCTGNIWNWKVRMLRDGVTWIVVRVVSGTGHFCALGDYTMLTVIDTDEILSMF